MSNIIDIDKYGSKIWYNEKGEIHRTDGPAVELSNGINKQWWINGKRHRTDGPAVEFADGSKMWFVKGVWHRTDGPAIERCDGSKEWYINGVEYTEEKFNEIVEYEQFKKELGELFKI
jgi:hypothetical protein